MIELYPVSRKSPGRLAVALRPRGGDWLPSELADLKSRGWTVLVTALEAAELIEFELDGLADGCEALGLTWVHFPVKDRGLPSVNSMTSLASQLQRELERDAGVAVHCRQGIGRSSLIVASTLVVGGETPESAWSQVAAARGRSVPDTPEQHEWLTTFALGCT